MMRQLATLLRRMTSPLLVLNVLFLLLNCYLLRQPDQVLPGDENYVIDIAAKETIAKLTSPSVLVMPIDEYEGRSKRSKVDNKKHIMKTLNKPEPEVIEVPETSNQSDDDKKQSTSPLEAIEMEERRHQELKRLYAERRKTYVVPDIRFTNLVNCKALLANNSREMAKATAVLKERPKVPIYEEYYLEWTKDCQHFKDSRGYIQIPLTEEEENFPLAFSISMFKDAEQTERLLRAIYQPQNVYCIHIDTKSSLLLHQTMNAIAGCFPNVFVASELKKVKWGDWSVLLPAVSCMQDLLKFHRGKWKYFINLTGQEFPLRTNYELVRIAKIFNGSNDIAGCTDRMDKERVNYLWTHRWSKTYQQTIFYNTMVYREPPAYNLTFYKGEIHGLFSPRFVEYIIESEVGQKYLEWCILSGHPSEHYWNTLNYNRHLKAPGGYEGPQDLANRYSLAPAVRAKHWQDQNYVPRECQGQLVRGICVYGLKDLPWLAQRKELAANKFYLTYHYLIYDCLEERHRNRTKLKDRIGGFFDENYYKNLPTVLYSRKDGLWT